MSAVVYRSLWISYGVLAPVYRSYKTIRDRNVKEYVRLMMYWIVFAAYSSFELFSDVFLSWFPFYTEFKIAFLVWISIPAARGSTLLYTRCIHPTLVKREHDIDAQIERLKGSCFECLVMTGTRCIGVLSGVVLRVTAKGQMTLVNHLRRRGVSLTEMTTTTTKTPTKKEEEEEEEDYDDVEEEEEEEVKESVQIKELSGISNRKKVQEKCLSRCQEASNPAVQPRPETTAAIATTATPMHQHVFPMPTTEHTLTLFTITTTPHTLPTAINTNTAIQSTIHPSNPSIPATKPHTLLASSTTTTTTTSNSFPAATTTAATITSPNTNTCTTQEGKTPPPPPVAQTATTAGRTLNLSDLPSSKNTDPTATTSKRKTDQRQTPIGPEPSPSKNNETSPGRKEDPDASAGNAKDSTKPDADSESSRIVAPLVLPVVSGGQSGSSAPSGPPSSPAEAPTAKAGQLPTAKSDKPPTKSSGFTKTHFLKSLTFFDKKKAAKVLKAPESK